jgi:hypothetical protein
MNSKQLNEQIHKKVRLIREQQIREQQENLYREYQYQLMLLERRLYQDDGQLWYEPGVNEPMPGPGQVVPPMAPQTPGSMNPSQSYPGSNPGLPYHETNNPGGYPVPRPGFGGGPKRPFPAGGQQWSYPPGTLHWWNQHPFGFPVYPFIQPPPNVPIMPPAVPTFHGIA